MKRKIIRIIHKFFNYKYFIRFLEKITGTKILKKLPLGLDPALDIRYNIPEFKFSTIVDVGSNIGQSENYFNKMYPEASIYCIEPIKETYSQLQKNIKGKSTKTYNIALGEFKTEIEIKISKDNPISDTNSLVESNYNKLTNYEIQKVKVDTLQSFFNFNNLKRINLLKIDTEGYDLNVLKGGEKLLEENKIDFIQVEVSMNPLNTFHENFSTVNSYLESKNYYIFGIYEQIHDFVVKKPILRRVNVVYISKEIAK